MANALLFPLTLATALGCGLVAGTFFAFSAFVMKALARLPVAQGVAAMQSINLVVLNPWFLGVFVGTAALSVAVASAAVFRWGEAASPWLLGGALAYLAGTVAVTRLCNLPRNDALAALDPVSAEAAVAWSRYVSEWTAWNHVRTVAALAALALLIAGLGRGC